MKKVLKLMIVGIMALIVFSLSGSEVKAAEGDKCGQVTRKNIYDLDCDIGNYPSCDVPTNDIIFDCHIYGTKCQYNYAWEDCSYQYNNGDPSCETYHNTVRLDCSDTSGGGGGGGGFNWFSCSSGQVKSCESPAEALAQNKYACTNRAYCDNHFSPELIGGACAYQDNGDPYKWDCQWNCSCCPTGSYRSCTQGVDPVTISINVNKCTQGDHICNNERTAALASCGQWHGHDYIYTGEKVKTKNYEESEDWDLTCIPNDCSCVAPPTPTCV